MPMSRYNSDIQVITFLASNNNVTLTNQAAAEDYFNAAASFTRKVDMTNYRQFKFVVRKAGGAGVAGSKLILKYTTSEPAATWAAGSWSHPQSGGAAVEAALTGTHTTIDSGWLTLDTAARGNYWLGVAMSGGDGVADPAVANIVVFLRK